MFSNLNIYFCNFYFYSFSKLIIGVTFLIEIFKMQIKNKNTHTKIYFSLKKKRRAYNSLILIFIISKCLRTSKFNMLHLYLFIYLFYSFFFMTICACFYLGLRWGEWVRRRRRRGGVKKDVLILVDCNCNYKPSMMKIWNETRN